MRRDEGPLEEPVSSLAEGVFDTEGSSAAGEDAGEEVVIQYHFPVVIEVRAATIASDLERIADLALHRLAERMESA